MAVAPLFVKDMATVKQQLRLTNAAAADALAILDAEVSAARVVLYTRLTEARVNTILTYTPQENPTSANEITRKRADHLEVNLIRMQLLRRLPTFFLDSSGDKSRAWNEEGFTREASPSDLQRELDRLAGEIEDAFTLLDDPTETDEIGFYAEAVTPDAADVVGPFNTIVPVVLQ